MTDSFKKVLGYIAKAVLLLIAFTLLIYVWIDFITVNFSSDVPEAFEWTVIGTVTAALTGGFVAFAEFLFRNRKGIGKAAFLILLMIEFLCYWWLTNIIYGQGLLTALVMIGSNILAVCLFFALYSGMSDASKADISSKARKAVLIMTAIQLVMIVTLLTALYFAI